MPIAVVDGPAVQSIQHSTMFCKNNLAIRSCGPPLNYPANLKFGLVSQADGTGHQFVSSHDDVQGDSGPGQALQDLYVPCTILREIA